MSLQLYFASVIGVAVSGQSRVPECSRISFSVRSLVDPARCHISNSRQPRQQSSDYFNQQEAGQISFLTTWPIRIKDFPARDGAKRQRNFVVFFSIAVHPSYMSSQKGGLRISHSVEDVKAKYLLYFLMPSIRI